MADALGGSIAVSTAADTDTVGSTSSWLYRSGMPKRYREQPLLCACRHQP